MAIELDSIHIVASQAFVLFPLCCNVFVPFQSCSVHQALLFDDWNKVLSEIFGC